jgi:hypothetical protein
MPVVCQGCWISAGWQRTADFDNSDPWLIWVARDPTPFIRPEVKVSAVGTEVFGNAVGDSPGTARIYGVERFADHVVFRLDNAIGDELTLADVFSDPLQIRVGVVGTGEAKLGFARVRHAADPPPKVELGSVQNYP